MAIEATLRSRLARACTRAARRSWRRPGARTGRGRRAGRVERRRPRRRFRRRARRLRRGHGAAAVGAGRRLGPALVGRQDTPREPRRPARPGRRLAQGHGPADAPAAGGDGRRRPGARGARQPRNHERARRPALRRTRASSRPMSRTRTRPCAPSTRRSSWHGSRARPTRISSGSFRRASSATAGCSDPRASTARGCSTLPAAIVINDTVYMHGGPSTALGGRSIVQLDADYSAAVASYIAAESELRKAGLIQPEDAYAKRPDLAQSRLDAMPADQKAVARTGGRSDSRPRTTLRCSARPGRTGIEARRSATSAPSRTC